MTERNLTRAEIPMCPREDCGSEVTGPRDTDGMKWCGACKEWVYFYMGYYAPDVSGVVAEMTEYIAQDSDPGQEVIASWRDRLEGKDTEVGR